MRLRNDPEAMPKLIKSGFLVTVFPFEVDNNFIIELGMGKGEMLTELANRNPSKQFLGIEKFATVAAKAAKKAENLNLKNFHIICEDIAKLPILLKGQVGTIWLTFSDPWPKKKHAERRLTFKRFLDIYKTILNNEGVLKFKTDNDKLFEWSIEHMLEYGLKLNNVTRDFHNHEASTENVKTGYEIKWSEQSKKINYLEAKFN